MFKVFTVLFYSTITSGTAFYLIFCDRSIQSSAWRWSGRKKEKKWLWICIESTERKNHVLVTDAALNLWHISQSALHILMFHVIRLCKIILEEKSPYKCQVFRFISHQRCPFSAPHAHHNDATAMLYHKFGCTGFLFCGVRLSGL